MNKKINLIVGFLSETRGFGYQGELPWPKIPTDLKYFKDKTTNHTVIMGKKTWLSIPEKYRPFSDRENIVVSSTLQASDLPNGVLLAKTLTEAIAMATREEIFLIGGSGIYDEAMKTGIVNMIFATVIHAEFNADRFFPALDDTAWQSIFQGSSGIDEKSQLRMQFMTLINKKNSFLLDAY